VRPEPHDLPPGLSQGSAVFACCQRSLPPSTSASVAGLQWFDPAWPHGSLCSSSHLRSGGESEVIRGIGASCCAPFNESEQLEPHPQRLASTSKPISPVVGTSVWTYLFVLCLEPDTMSRNTRQSPGAPPL
jgi:hypothetical protein